MVGGFRIYLPITILVAFLVNNVSSVSLSHDPNDVLFYLLKNGNDSEIDRIEIQYYNYTSLKASGIMPNRPTAFITHGYFDNPWNAESLYILVQAFMNSTLPQDINVIAVDWSKLSTPNNTKINPIDYVLGYPFAIGNIGIAGTRVGEFMAWLLRERIIPADKFHLIGHSLGAHVSGKAGNWFQNRFAGLKIARISAMDPAGPLTSLPLQFTYSLTHKDAEFVDIYHTNTGIFGEAWEVGHVDFYVNRKVFQPGCDNPDITEVITCSHIFSIRLYAATISHPIWGCYCPHFRVDCQNPCVHRELAGIYTSSRVRGKYHIKTGRNP